MKLYNPVISHISLYPILYFVSYIRYFVLTYIATLCNIHDTLIDQWLPATKSRVSSRWILRQVICLNQIKLLLTLIKFLPNWSEWSACAPRCPWAVGRNVGGHCKWHFLVRAALCRRCLTAVGHYFR